MKDKLLCGLGGLGGLLVLTGLGFALLNSSPDNDTVDTKKLFEPDEDDTIEDPEIAAEFNEAEVEVHPTFEASDANTINIEDEQ